MAAGLPNSSGHWFQWQQKPDNRPSPPSRIRKATNLLAKAPTASSMSCTQPSRLERSLRSSKATTSDCVRSISNWDYHSLNVANGTHWFDLAGREVHHGSISANQSATSQPRRPAVVGVDRHSQQRTGRAGGRRPITTASAGRGHVGAGLKSSGSPDHTAAYDAASTASSSVERLSSPGKHQSRTGAP